MNDHHHDTPALASRLTPVMRQEHLERSQREAAIVREFFASSVITTLVSKSFGETVHAEGFKVFRDQLIADCGQPMDPVAMMLIDQLAWAHHRIADLHIRAATLEHAEQSVLLEAAATRLMGEFRKMSLALREYRSPARAPQVTVQNVAAGDQQIAVVARSASAAQNKNSLDSELVSNGLMEALPEGGSLAHAWEELETRGSRPPEPAEAPRPQRRRPSPAPGGGASPPPLDSLHGPPNP